MPGQLLSENEFQSQMEAIEDIPVTDELRSIIRGQPDVASAIRDAKVNALNKARKKCAAAILAADEKMRANQFLPLVSVEEQADTDEFLSQTS